MGKKKCFVLLCPIGEQFLLSSFREFVHDAYSLATLARFVHQACACVQEKLLFSTFLTRNEGTTNESKKRLGCYKPPISGPAFGLSDHLSITVLPNIRQKSQTESKIIQTRDKRPSRVASLGRYLLEIPWGAVLSENKSCDDKLAAVTRIIDYGFDAIMPVHQTDRPWLNADLKRLIHKRQQAFSSDDTLLFKLLRNKVNRERKSCGAIYYNNKVHDLKNTRPRDWWREVKQLC